MTQSLMLIALGFMCASLLALFLTPPLWRHVVRITTKKIQSRSPLTMAEIEADRDQLRAEYALSTRKLELTVEELKGKLARLSVDLARADGENKDVADRAMEKSADIAERDARIVKLTTRLAPVEEDLRIASELIDQQAEKIRQQGEIIERQTRSLTETTQLAAGKDTKIAYLQKKSLQQAAEDRTIEMAHQAMSDRVNQLGRLAARIEGRRADLYDTRREVMALRETLSKQGGGLSKGQIKPYRERLAVVRRERDALAEDLRTAGTDAGKLLEEIQALDTTWQMRSNPYIKLRTEVEAVSSDMTRLSGSLNKDIQAAESLLREIVAGEAESDENVTLMSAADLKKKQSATIEATGNADPAEFMDEGDDDEEIPSLAERIRALQHELAQN